MRFLNRQLSLATALLLTSNTLVFGERWSRQLTPDAPSTANDWVPIRNGKSVSYGEDLQSAAQTNQFQFFAEPQNNRFNLQQTHPAHGAHQTALPSEINSYSSQNAPPFQFFNSPQKTRTVQTFGGSVNRPNAEPLVQNSPPFQYMQEIQRGPHVHHYQSQPIPKSLQNFPQSVPPFQQLGGSRIPQFQNLPPPPPFQPVPTPPPFQTLQGEQQQPQSEEQVQLLYVPYDSLYQPNQQSQPPRDSNRYNVLNQPVSASLINDFYSQNEVQENPTKTPTTKRPTISPVTKSLRPTTPFENNSKPKPHQPPLSMFVAIDKFKGKATEADVLNTLKNSNSIDVMDSISKNSPKVFIGPSGMEPPAGYEKFDLPYLSSIEGTRYERKIEQLPFFVAPLSYRTPPGFSKIPLPAPHVGSVVVNQPPNTIESNESNAFTRDNYFTKQPAIDSTLQFGQSNSNSNSSPKTKKVTLTSGFNYGPNGNVQLIRNEYQFPTTHGASSPTFERTVFTTPRPTLSAQTASPSTADTPLTKVAYKHIEEKRNYGQSTVIPTTVRTTATKSRFEQFPTSPPRSTARAPTTKSSFIELEEHKTVNEEYFGVVKEKKPTFSFKFGSEVDKPTHNFNFKPIPDFDFGDTDYATTKKPRTKATTQYTFPSSTPSPSFDFRPTVSLIENQNEFAQVNGGNDDSFFEYRTQPRPTQDYTFNRFNLGNEQTFTQDTAYTPAQYPQEIVEQVDDDLSATTESYSLPSELTSISPQLPGWINSLMDDKWMQKSNVTEKETTTTTTTTTTTRRPQRGSRRPNTSASRSTATESTVERRPVTRRQRPTTYVSRNSVSSTESSFPSRQIPSRGGSKVRFNGTSEDRSRLNTRTRAPVKKEEQNIEYQRDVLNQNYPSSVRPIPETTTDNNFDDINAEQYYTPSSVQLVNDYNAPIEGVEVIPLGGNRNENVHTQSETPTNYDNTVETSTLTTSTTHEAPLPSNHKKYSSFVGLQEPMQVPQHKAHRLKGNFNYKNRDIDSFYNTNLQNSKTQKPDKEDVETLITVPTTQATTHVTTTETTATEASIPKRTNFPRRRVQYTTTVTPDSETTESSGVNFSKLSKLFRFSHKFFLQGRTRGRKENAVVVKRVRTRTRPTITTTEEPETTRRTVAVRTRGSYNRNRESTRDRATGNDDETREIKVRSLIFNFGH